MRPFLRRNAATLALVALACAVLGALAHVGGACTAAAAFRDAGAAAAYAGGRS